MGFGLEDRKWNTALLLFVTTAGLVAANPLSVGFNAYAQTTEVPEFVAPSPFYGQTMHLPANEPVNFSLQATDDDAGDTVTITAAQLPLGAMFNSVPGNPATATFSWADPEPAGGYSPVFIATDQDGHATELAILLAIFESTPVPTITLDRQEYVLGNTVYVTVKDERADVDFTELDTIDVRATSDADAVGIIVNLTESEETPRTFVGSFQVTGSIVGGTLVASNGDEIRVEYDPSIDDPEIEATATIDSAAVEFDRTIYPSTGLANVVVIDNSANTNPGSVQEVTVDVFAASDDVHLILDETGQNTGVFAGTFSLSDTTSGATTLQVQLGEEIQVVYGSRNDTAKIYYPLTVSFTNDVYSDTDLVELMIIDVEENADSLEIETIFADITSNADNTGFTIPLRENGTDTGVFINTAYIAFTNGDNPDHANNVLRVNVNETTNSTITASYGNITDEATVIDGIAGWDGHGVGTSGASMTPGVEIGNAQIINCSTFGGDGDHDGICNNWELGGSNLMRIYYPQTGGQYYNIQSTCYPVCPTSTTKDVFVEIDYVVGYKPYHDGTKYVALENARQEVNGKFVLHYIVNQDVTGYLNADLMLPVWSQSAGGPPGYDQIKESNFGTLSERNQYPGGITSNYMNAKRQVYHYALFAFEQIGDEGASGRAEILGNDIIVSLGAFAPSGLNGSTIAMEEGTFLHELGHNLGLDHGGGFLAHSIYFTGYPTWIPDHMVNCKPNYASLMNYVRQIPPDGVNLGDTTHFSKAVSSDLDVTNPAGLDESKGVKSGLSNWTPIIAYGTAGGIMTAQIDNIERPINWDNAGGYTTGVTAPSIVNMGIPGCDAGNADLAVQANGGLLKGYNDMSASGFVYDFRVHNPAIFVNGVHEERGPLELDIETWTLINELKGPDTFVLNTTVDGSSYGITGISDTLKARSDAFDMERGRIGSIMLDGEGTVELRLQPDMVDGTWNAVDTIIDVDGSDVTSRSSVRDMTADNPYISVTLDLAGNGRHEVTIVNPAIVPEFPLTTAILTIMIVMVIGLTVALRGGRLGSFFGRP